MSEELQEQEESRATELNVYLGLSGDNHSAVPIILSETRAQQLIQTVKKQFPGPLDVNKGWKMVYEQQIYTENSEDLLSDILPLKKEGLQVRILVNDNAEKLQQMLGNNFMGEETWKKLGVEVPADEIPAMSCELFEKVLEMKHAGKKPVVILDLGMSIEELESHCEEAVIFTGAGNEEKLTAEPCYKESIVTKRWLLLDGSEDGVLPGSRNKTYEEQVRYMKDNYPGFEVGSARELATFYVLHQIESETPLFSATSSPTWGIVKERYHHQQGSFKDKQIALGAGSELGLVVHYSCCRDSHGLFSCFVDGS